MRGFDKAIGWIQEISRYGVWTSGILVVGAALLVSVDVVARKLFNFSLAGANEITGYVFGISIMLSLSSTLVNRANIRIDVFYWRLSPRTRAILDVFGMILLVGFLAAIAWRAWFLIVDTYQHNAHSVTPLHTPMVIPQTPWFAGLVFALGSGLVLVAAGIAALVRKDWDYVTKRLGVPTVDEQIEEEL